MVGKKKKVIPTKRNGRYYPKVKPEDAHKVLKSYIAVTEILGNSVDKPALRYWYGLQAARIALENPELGEKAVMSEVGKISSKAARRGSTIHNLTEVSDVEGSTIDPAKLPEEYRGYMTAFNKFFYSACHLLSPPFSLHFYAGLLLIDNLLINKVID